MNATALLYIRKYWHVIASVALVLATGVRNEDTVQTTAKHVERLDKRVSDLEKSDAAKTAQLTDIQVTVHDIQNRMYK